MLRHVPTFRLLLLAAILIATTRPGAIAHGDEIKMRVSQMTQGDTQPYVAVMGQIARPGVYELPAALPQLAEFLNFAGGLTPNASGSLRVIRQGRSSQFFLSARLSLQLLPDDLIIVESKQFVAGRQNGKTSAANGWQRNASTMSAAPPIVQIGLVNLISRPVILDIPGEQVNLAQVLSLLHQPVAGNAEVTVIKPGSGVQNVSLEQAYETALATGMVLVFDPVTVNSGVLPRLPNTIRAGDNAEPAVTGASAGSDPPQTTVSATDLASGAQPAGHEALPVPQETLPVSSDTSNAASKPESVDESPAGSRKKTFPEPGSDAQSSGSLTESPDFQPLPDATDEKAAATEPIAAAAQPAKSIWPWLLVAGIVACCIGVALRLRTRNRSQRVATLAIAQPVGPPENSLELLISGALPIVEEALQLPYECEIFGRPLETSPYRTDPAQALSGPHYVPQPNSTTAPAIVVVEAASSEGTHEPASAPAERKVRVDMRHPSSTVSVLDRALASFQGEQP